ncbi:MAG: hypothetical protein KDK70_36115 [Myxococcales bacterium]|nr:hypothetical protein [Myxococcales bacterium]
MALGCKKSDDQGDEASAYTPPPELPTWTPKAAELAKAPPGPAYLAVKDQGIAIIDEHGSRLLARLEHDVLAMTVTTKGELWFTTFEGLFALRGTEVVEIADEETLGLTTLETAEDVREDPKGRAWVIGSKGTIAVREGNAWTTRTQEQTGMELQFRYEELVSDQEGRSWLAADDALYRQKGDALEWEAVDVSAFAPEDYMRNFKQVAMVDDGSIVTCASDGLAVFTEGTWKKAALQDHFGSIDHLAARGSTIAVMVGFDLQRVGPEGVKVSKAGKDTWSASRLFDLEIDGAGRVWIATDHGPVVVTGDEARQWPPGTLPGVLGRARRAADCARSSQRPRHRGLAQTPQRVGQA